MMHVWDMDFSPRPVLKLFSDCHSRLPSRFTMLKCSIVRVLSPCPKNREDPSTETPRATRKPQRSLIKEMPNGPWTVMSSYLARSDLVRLACVSKGTRARADDARVWNFQAKQLSLSVCDGENAKMKIKEVTIELVKFYISKKLGPCCDEWSSLSSELSSVKDYSRYDAALCCLIRKTNRLKLNGIGKEWAKRHPLVIPKGLWALQNLQELNLEHQNLDALQPEIGRLSKLKVLKLDHNFLRGIPDEIAKLQNLESLSLNFNKLAHIPPSICALRQLTSLSLYKNELVEVPQEISGLHQISFLSFGRNQLKRLSTGITKLNSLEDLILAGNPGLSDLPASLGELPLLKVIWISQDQSEALSTELKQKLGRKVHVSQDY